MVRRSAMLLGFLASVATLGAQDALTTIGITTAPLLLRHEDSTVAALPAPFTRRDRWAYYLRRTYQPQRLGILAIETGVDHALREPHCWNRSATSYLTRYSRS